MSGALLDLAAEVVRRARALGADEVRVGVSEGTSTTLARRDRKVEEATAATTRSLGLSLLVEGRWSTHGTSDLRPEAVARFLANAVEATRLLEPDPDRALPPPELCGRGSTEATLDHLDPTWARTTADDRAAWATALEEALLARRDARFVSAEAHVSDGHSRTAVVASNGFADVSESASFGFYGGVTLADDDGRKPEGGSWYGAVYRSDVPSFDRIADEAHAKAREALGAGPIASGRYPLVLENRVAGRILHLISAPISGAALHQGRSCLADALGTPIGSELLTIVDDPTLPRGLASTPWDADLMVARPRTIVERGVLTSFYLSMYHARKLGRPPTTGGSTNWVLPVGDRPALAHVAGAPKAILVTGFLGGNSNPTTGDFSFGIRGRLLEHGVPTAPLAEMNVAGNVKDVLHRLVALGNDPWTFSSTRSPTLVFDDVPFSGT
jgi:PmbA protein